MYMHIFIHVSMQGSWVEQHRAAMAACMPPTNAGPFAYCLSNTTFKRPPAPPHSRTRSRSRARSTASGRSRGRSHGKDSVGGQGEGGGGGGGVGGGAIVGNSAPDCHASITHTHTPNDPRAPESERERETHTHTTADTHVPHAAAQHATSAPRATATAATAPFVACGGRQRGGSLGMLPGGPRAHHSSVSPPRRSRSPGGGGVFALPLLLIKIKPITKMFEV